MNWFQNLVRQPNAVLGTLTAGINMLILFEILDWTDKQLAGVNVFAALLFGLVALVVTPSNEVVAQQVGDGPVVAGAKAETHWGIRRKRVVEVNPSRDLADPDDPPAAA